MRNIHAVRAPSGSIFAIACEPVSGSVRTMTRHNRTLADPPSLTTSRGAALYIGALLGPGLLLLPGLAAAEAGPASIVAWLALLILSGLFAAVFSALGRRYPQAGGVIGYVAAGLGRRAGQATGWSFLAGVVCGAPIVCMIGAGYVTRLAGGGRSATAAVAGLLLIVVIVLAMSGLRTSTGAQLALVGLLIAVITVAVAGSAGSARIGYWSPFAPHGWMSVGHAAATLMLSFVGWEAVAPLTTRFARPARQLPKVIGIAIAVTSALYLGLAVATIGVLGPASATSVPLALLLGRAVGTAGQAVAAIAAVVLTLGAVNAYVTGATTMARQLLRRQAIPADGRFQARPHGIVAAIATTGATTITLYWLKLASATALVMVPTALFLAVYLGCMLSAARVLGGATRLAAVPAALAVIVMLAYCGWALALPVAVALTVAFFTRSRPVPAATARGMAGGATDGQEVGGSSISIVSPPPSRGCAWIVPSWATAIARTMDRPRPAPRWSVRSAASLRNGSKTNGSAAAGMSWPVLRTVNAGCAETVTSTQPSGWLNMIALVMRLLMSRSSSSGSPGTSRSASTRRKLTPRLAASSAWASRTDAVSWSKRTGTLPGKPRSLSASTSSPSMSFSLCSLARSSWLPSRCRSLLLSGSSMATSVSSRCTASWVRSSCEAFDANRRWLS